MRPQPTAAQLRSLFSPRSVAVIGASARPGRPGHQVLENLRRMDPSLTLFPITPQHEEVVGLPCFSDVSAAPPPDLAIIAGASSRIEHEAAAAIEHGAKSLLVFGAPAPDAERAAWLERLDGLAAEARVPLLGPDSLGFINYVGRRGASWAMPEESRPGGIAVISQSGTVYWEAITNDPRLRFSFCAHSGLESTLSMADLVNYALSLDETRVIGLYLETVRDTEGFVGALAAASERDIPVVAMYAGRSERSRAQMTTHAGRLSGDRAALEGVLRRFGVIRVESPDEWWTTLTFLSTRRVGAGGMAAVMDSGGGLAMFLDYAEELQLPLANLGSQTQEQLASVLGVKGEVHSALDFWVGDADRHSRTADLITTLAEDDDTAAVMAFTTYGESPGAGFAPSVAEACFSGARATSKPVFAATYTSRQVHPELMLKLADEGIPTLDGMRTAMLAARHAISYRSHQELLKRAVVEPQLPAELVSVWRERLSGETELSEKEALSFLSAFDISCVEVVPANDESEAVAAAEKVGYPIVLKTDEGIAHKAARGGVILSLADAAAVRTAYASLAASLGPRAIVAPMRSGLEVAIGVVPGQFGPTLMVGAGGTMIELLSDRSYLLAPSSPDDVAAAVSGLEIIRVLKATLGADSPAERQLYEIASKVSRLAYEFRETLSELDINPILVGPQGCVAVDALIALRPGEAGRARYLPHHVSAPTHHFDEETSR